MIASVGAAEAILMANLASYKPEKLIFISGAGKTSTDSELTTSVKKLKMWWRRPRTAHPPMV